MAASPQIESHRCSSKRGACSLRNSPQIWLVLASLRAGGQPQIGFVRSGKITQFRAAFLCRRMGNSPEIGFVPSRLWAGIQPQIGFVPSGKITQFRAPSSAAESGIPLKLASFFLGGPATALSQGALWARFWCDVLVLQELRSDVGSPKLGSFFAAHPFVKLAGRPAGSPIFVPRRDRQGARCTDSWRNRNESDKPLADGVPACRPGSKTGGHCARASDPNHVTLRIGFVLGRPNRAAGPMTR
jgi:hypothetical protein